MDKALAETAADRVSSPYLLYGEAAYQFGWIITSSERSLPIKLPHHLTEVPSLPPGQPPIRVQALFSFLFDASGDELSPCCTKLLTGPSCRASKAT